MTKDNSKGCRYKDPLTRWVCPYEALPDSIDGFCIFHEKSIDKDIDNFTKGIKAILKDKSSQAYHFQGFFFPRSVSFENVEFKRSVFFNYAQFSGKRTSFFRAQFTGERTEFRGVDFAGEKTFLSQAKFMSKRTAFDGAKFVRNTYLVGSEFGGEHVSFSGAEFSGRRTVLHGTKFQSRSTRFYMTRFSGNDVSFYYCRFGAPVLFARTVFKAETTFTGADLTKCIFTEVDLKNVDFALLVWSWKSRLANETRWARMMAEELRLETKQPGEQVLSKRQVKRGERVQYVKTSETYGQLKVHFHNKRDFAKAGMFHFREQECKRKACHLPQEFFKCIFLWILKLSCGYGEKLRNVGLTSLALIFVFALGYMFLGLHNAHDSASLAFSYDFSFKNIAPITAILKDFGTSLIFSIKGFFPLWRFQQYRVVGDFANLVAGIEFLLGAFMVGLFIYVFRRRMEK